jgi:hypothetical protein
MNKNDFYQAHQIDYILTTEMNERISIWFWTDFNPFFEIYWEVLNGQVDTNYYLTKTAAKRNIENENRTRRSIF